MENGTGLLYRKGPSWSWSYGSWIYTTCVISAYHHDNSEFESRSWRCVLDTTICDKVFSNLRRSVVFTGFSGFLHQ